MISLLHPSRGRPLKADIAYQRWTSSCVVEVEHILSLDKSDPQLDYYLGFKWEKVIINHNRNVVEATNAAAKEVTGDILVYMSDDFDCPENWAYLITNEFDKYRGPVLLKVDDCLQRFDVPVLTIPIVNREFYETLGYFWHPDYNSMFVDEDLYWTAKKLGALKLAPHLKFPHNHVSIGKAENDDTYRRSAANWDQGKAVFARRKAAGFPL